MYFWVYMPFKKCVENSKEKIHTDFRVSRVKQKSDRELLVEFTVMTMFICIKHFAWIRNLESVV